MTQRINRILVLGGGSAGWLTAGLLGAEYGAGLHITLVESPDVPAIGVGEGTWPSMRETLRRIGVGERDFMSECDASFKQGSKFIGWREGADDEFYYHPFSLPQGFFEVNSAPYWQANMPDTSFAVAVSPQQRVCERQLAPKQLATPPWAGVLNYGYHLDAVKFGRFLRQHCIGKLGIRHVVDHVTGVELAADGSIASLNTVGHGDLGADLFIDCSGMGALLLGKHLQQPLLSARSVLFNDRALAVQVPYPDSRHPVASATLATAQRAGWIWDIGLPTRRGVGYVYSAAHTSEGDAEQELRRYLQRSMSAAEAEAAELRSISFEPGHRQAFWRHNCVAVGMAAGFIEPLEASALALVEMSAAMIRDDLPATTDTMELAAARFNKRFTYRWQRVLDFLKLHYVLSARRDTDYWRDHQDPAGIPERLQELLRIWRFQAPSRRDFVEVEEIFTAASYQYVLYGLGFRTEPRSTPRCHEDPVLAARHIEDNLKQTRRLLRRLPGNRQLLTEAGSEAQPSAAWPLRTPA